MGFTVRSHFKYPSPIPTILVNRNHRVEVPSSVLANKHGSTAGPAPHGVALETVRLLWPDNMSIFRLLWPDNMPVFLMDGQCFLEEERSRWGKPSPPLSTPKRWMLHSKSFDFEVFSSLKTSQTGIYWTLSRKSPHLLLCFFMPLPLPSVCPLLPR